MWKRLELLEYLNQGYSRSTFFLLHCKNYIVQRNIFLIGIRELNNDLPIDERTLLFGNEILNEDKNTKNI
jgi:hypothetical protein